MISMKTTRPPQPWVAGKSEWTSLHDRCWKLASKRVRREAGLAVPVFMDNAFCKDKIWVWDSCFAIFFTRYLHDAYPGINNLDLFYSWQRSDGYISMTYVLATGEEAYGERVNPPLFAWAEREHYRQTGDKDRICRILPHLVRHDRWLEENRQRRDGLFWFEDGGSSGMDNSPRVARTPDAGRHLGWVDLTAQQALSAAMISQLAAVIGDTPTARAFLEKAKARSTVLNDLCWCEKARFYLDRLDASNWMSAKTAAGFWPMLSRSASPARLRQLIAHLGNPATFGRPCPVPTLAADDPNYRELGDYWLGGVWAPANYMITKGLQANKRLDLARSLAIRYLDWMATAHKRISPRSIWECYSPETPEPSVTGRGSDQRVKPDFVGWSGLGPIAMFYEDILGINADVPENTIRWNVGLPQGHGIKNFRFGIGCVSLEADARKGTEDKVHAVVVSDIGFTLRISVGDRCRTIRIAENRKTDVSV